MAKFFDKLKDSSLGAVHRSTSIATGLWTEYGDLLTSRSLALFQEISTSGKHAIADEETFRKAFDRIWDRLPWQIRLAGRKRIFSLFLHMRDKIFVVEGEAVRIQPNAKERIATVLKSVLDPNLRPSEPSTDVGEQTQ